MSVLTLLGGSRAMLYALAAIAASAIIGAIALRDHLREAEIRSLSAVKAAQEIQLADAQRVNRDSAQALAGYQAEIARQQTIAAGERREHATAAARLAALTRKINDATPADDGPVAPVLRTALDGLRNPVPAGAPAR